MTIEFQYTFEDLVEASTAHVPKVSAAQRQRRGWIATAIAVVAVIAIMSIAYTVDAPRPLFIDFVMPVMGLLTFLMPLVLYREFKSKGVRGALAASKANRGTIGWLVFAALYAAAWVLLGSSPWSPNVADGAAASRLKVASDVLLPHTVWLVLTGLLCWYLVRQSNAQWMKIWNGATNLHRPFTLTTSDEGITIADPLARHELKWFAFDRVIETQNLFLLYVAEHLFHMVPKRAFADAAQADEFRAIIDNRITRRPTAFPVLPVGG